MIGAALGAAAVAGLASVPHCAARCGPVSTFAGKSAGAAARYHAGRLAGYAVAGAIAGASGELVEATLPARWGSAILSLTLAASLAIAARRLWRDPAPRDGLVSIGRRPRRARRSDRVFAWMPKRPLTLGLMTALLPCGALYSALLIAASSGSAIYGAASMITFATLSGLGLAVVSAVAVKVAGLAKRGVETLFMRRIIATALVIGAVLFVVRPIVALTQPEPSCHASAHG